MSNSKTRLLLIRHGQTSWNADGRWQGHGDPGLTDEGVAQARRLARTLRDDQHRTWVRIISSDLERARQTAVAIADQLGLEIELDRRLRELDVGTWSGLTREEIRRLDPERLHAFEQGEPTIRPGGGESRIAIRERTHEFVTDLAKRCGGDRLIVVTHLGVIRALIPGADPSNAGQLEVIAEELAARGIDRRRRVEDGAL